MPEVRPAVIAPLSPSPYLASHPGHPSSSLTITISATCAHLVASSVHCSVVTTRVTYVPTCPGQPQSYTLSLSNCQWLPTKKKKKVEKYICRFSGVKLHLHFHYKLKLIVIYNCFNFAFNVLKALLLTRNFIFKLVFSIDNTYF